MGIDPYDDTTAWVAGEYPTSCGFLLPSCCGSWVADVTR